MHSKTQHAASWLRQIRVCDHTEGNVGSSNDNLNEVKNNAGRCLLLIQEVKTNHKKDSKTFFDNGSTCVLVRNDFANEAGLQGTDIIMEITTVGGNQTTLHTKMYVVELVTTEGKTEKLLAYGINEISSEISAIQINNIIHHFLDVGVSSHQLSRPTGKIDLLIGQRYARLHPTKAAVSEDLVLYKSMFGTGWVLGGYNPNAAPEGTRITDNAHKIFWVSVNIKQVQNSPDIQTVMAHNAKHSLHHSGPSYKETLKKK